MVADNYHTEEYIDTEYAQIHTIQIFNFDTALDFFLEMHT